MKPRLLLFIAGLFILRLAAYGLMDGPHWSLAKDYCMWDCGWYGGLAEGGYMSSPAAGPLAHGQANWAFFPLFPGLVHLVWRVLPISVFAAGLIVANLFLLLFVIAAALYLPRRRPGANAAALAAFLFAFPYGIYFSLAYTESLFAFLSVAALYCLAAERLAAGALFSGLLSATRVPGILFTPVVAVRAIAPAAAAWRVGDRQLAWRRAGDALLPIALAPLGLFVFMAFLYAHVGDGLAFAHIQAAWDRQSALPFTTLYNNLFDMDWRAAFARYAGSNQVSEYAALAGFCVAIRLLALRFWTEAWLLAGMIVLALSAGLTSMQRFVLANPVFLIFLFDWLWQSALVRRCFIPLVTACAALQLYFVHCWLESYAFLM